MKKLLPLPLLLFALFLTAAVQAQTKKVGTKNQNTVEVPPPPQEDRTGATKIDALPTIEFDSTAAPNDELTRELKKMLQLTDAVNLGLSTAENMLQQQKRAADNDEMNQFFTVFLKELKSPRVYSLFENIFVKIYRKHYTLAEVKQLNQFYATPLGKKTIQVTPATSVESQEQCGKLGQMLAMEVFQQMQE